MTTAAEASRKLVTDKVSGVQATVEEAVDTVTAAIRNPSQGGAKLQEEVVKRIEKAQQRALAEAADRFEEKADECTKSMAGARTVCKTSLQGVVDNVKATALCKPLEPVLSSNGTM